MTTHERQQQRQQQRQYDDPFTPEEVQELLVHLIRSPAVAAVAGNNLQHGHFAHEGMGYQFVWDVLHGLLREHGAEVVASNQFQDRLTNKIRAILSSDTVQIATVDDDQMQLIDDLFDEASKRPADAIDPDYGIELLKRFLLERDLQASVYSLAETLKIAPDPTLPSRLQGLAETGARIQSLSLSTPDSIEAEWDAHEERLARFRGRELVGLKTGIQSLDSRTLGIRGLGALGAGAGVGKTALALNIAIGVCRHHAVNDAVVVFVSLEMPRHELYSRVKCNLADLEWSTLVRGSKGRPDGGPYFNQADQRKLQQAKQRMQDEQIGSRLTILDREQLGESLSAERLAMITARAKAKVSASRALTVVDYVQILPVPEAVSGYTDLEQDRYRVRVLQDVIRKSKSAGNQDGDTVLFISETRKPTKSKDPWASGLAELMGSARLGYAVDFALLYRRMTTDEIKEYYGGRSEQSLQDDGRAPIMLSLEKGRDGMTRGQWGMQFHFWKSIFEEVEPVPEDQRGLLVLPPEPDEWVESEETAGFEFDSLFHSASEEGFTGIHRERPR